MISAQQSKDLQALRRLREDAEFAELRRYLGRTGEIARVCNVPVYYAINKLLALLDG